MTARHRRGCAIVALVLAALMTWCALPSAIGELIAVPAGVAIERAKDGGPVTPAALAVAAHAQMRAARWTAPDRHLTDAAVAMIAEGASGPDAASVPMVLTAASRERPRDRRNWLRLAAARLPTDRAGARAAWSMAVRAAPFDPPGARSRADIGFALLPSDDAVFVATLTHQLRIAALTDVDGLAAAAVAHGTVPFVRAALLADPDLDWRFSIALASAMRTDRAAPR